MNKDYNKKKKATIITLSLAAVCLAGGLFYYMGTLGNTVPPVSEAESEPPVQTEVVVPEIEAETPASTESSKPVETSKPVESGQTSEAEESTTAGSQTQTGAKEKPSDGKPKSPTEATPPAEPPKETESSAPVENPDESGTCQPEHTPQQETNQPQGGETRSDGAVYVPGFGWIEDSGEENTTTVAPNAGTGDPVGDM